jgi:hypothetical protein
MAYSPLYCTVHYVVNLFHIRPRHDTMPSSGEVLRVLRDSDATPYGCTTCCTVEYVVCEIAYNWQGCFAESNDQTARENLCWSRSMASGRGWFTCEEPMDGADSDTVRIDGRSACHWSTSEGSEPYTRSASGWSSRLDRTRLFFTRWSAWAPASRRAGNKHAD